MEKIKHLYVTYQDRKVGTLALHKEYFVAFEYDKEWLIDGFAISPFSLPLEKKVFIPKIEPFEGLHGVFADSLPDGWGRLLVERLMLTNQIQPKSVGNLERLAIVGSSGMGALAYEPEKKLINNEHQEIDLDALAFECHNILTTQYSDRLDDLFALGGTSGGARPKILTEIDNALWIIKFPSSQDGKNIGRQEYEYSLCAKACGIIMEKTRLFTSKQCEGYFGTKRFDRTTSGENCQRIHMVSASGLLETTHRIPNLDYNILMKLTLQLTKSFDEVEKLYRLMCFNVFAHNRDDHSKNFTFIYNEPEARWLLSPAYDLTHSYSIGGQHATTVNGNGVNPNQVELLEVAKTIGLDLVKAKNITNLVYDCVNSCLGEHLKKHEF